MKYYIFHGEVLPPEEITTYFGDKTTYPYAQKLYCGEITLDDIPEDLRETVQTAVNNRINRWGAYEDQLVSYNDMKEALQEIDREDNTNG